MDRLHIPHEGRKIALVAVVAFGALALGLALLMTLARAF